MEIYTKLKEARTRAGLIQEEAAERISVSRQTISNWENGKSLPDIVSVMKMSDLYQVSLDELLKGDQKMQVLFQHPLDLQEPGFRHEGQRSTMREHDRHTPSQPISCILREAYSSLSDTFLCFSLSIPPFTFLDKMLLTNG